MFYSPDELVPATEGSNRTVCFTFRNVEVRTCSWNFRATITISEQFTLLFNPSQPIVLRVSFRSPFLRSLWQTPFLLSRLKKPKSEGQGNGQITSIDVCSNFRSFFISSNYIFFGPLISPDCLQVTRVFAPAQSRLLISSLCMYVLIPQDDGDLFANPSVAWNGATRVALITADLILRDSNGVKLLLQ